MSKGIPRHHSVLTLCFLLSVAQVAYGQHRQMQQNSHVSRQTLQRNSTAREQRPAVSHPLTSTLHQKQSDTAVHARSLLSSKPQRHAAQSIHVRPFPFSHAGERSGTHDFNHGVGMQRQDPWAGRGGAFRSMFAAGQRNPRNGQSAKQRLAEQPASAGPDRPDLQAGRGARRSGQQQAAGPSDGRGRSNMSSEAHTRTRRIP